MHSQRKSFDNVRERGRGREKKRGNEERKNNHVASARQARDKKWLQKHNKKSVVARAAIVPHFFSNVERTVSKLWYNLCYAQRGTETAITVSVKKMCNKKGMEKFEREMFLFFNC